MRTLALGFALFFVMVVGNVIAAAIYGGNRPIPLWGSFIEGGWAIASLAVCVVGIVRFARWLRAGR